MSAEELKECLKNDFPTLNEFEESKFSIQNGVRRGFGKYNRKLIFVLIVTINILINIDHGVIPAATTVLMEELNIDSMSLGMIGSVLFLGLTCGAVIAGFLFNNYAPKWIISISITICGFCLYSFTEANSLFSLCFWRFACGFCQIFTLIYFPVWVDKFGIFESRIFWISYLQLGTPLGTMLGYVLEAFAIRVFGNWRLAFHIQTFFLMVSVCILIFTPDKFFSKNYKRSDLTRTLKQNFQQNAKEEFSYDLLSKYMVLNGPKYTRLSDFSVFSLQDEEEKKMHTNYRSIIFSLFGNKIYLFTMLTVCCLLFIVTAIQFWITDYMITELLVDINTVYITFSIVCITAPTSGVIAGGYLIDKMGSYTDNRSLEACYKVALLAALCGIPLPFINNIPIFTILMWGTLFLGGCILPGLTGMILYAAPPEHKEVANSLTHFCYNLIGYLPAPFIYGVIKKFNPQLALMLVMSVTFLGVLFLKYALKINNSIQEESSSQKHSIFRNYLEYKRFDTITRKESLRRSEAINAFYGRLSIV